MTVTNARRGARLVGRRLSLSGGRLAGIIAPLFRSMLDRVDRGLDSGAIHVTLPDGASRRLGGRTSGPEAAVRLNSWRALMRLALFGSAGWYQAWELGEWDSPDPVPLFALFMLNRRSLGNTGRAGGVGRWLVRATHALHDNRRGMARRNITYHYDLGTDFYTTWLDHGMTYSCARYDGDASRTLEAAQHAKIDAILDRLPPGDLVEIGCGWGSLGERALERGWSYRGITLSPDQLRYVEARLAPWIGRGRASVSLTDYRDVTGRFDALASVEMAEAVGMAYWPAYLDTIARLLRPGGRAAVQFITMAEDSFVAYAANADFIQTYIFPGGLLLSEARFRALAAARGLVYSDRIAFGADYATTLKVWRERFDAVVATGTLPAGFDARFVRLWRYYLMYCEGGFRGGGIDVVQVTLTKAS